MRLSEEKNRELTESISDVFFAMDNDLRYTYWNRASEKLTGIAAKDAIGKTLSEVFPNVDGEVEQCYRTVLRARQPKSFVTNYKIGNKEYIFEINAYPTIAGLSVFVKDVTESKKAEAELLASERKYCKLSESLKVAEEEILKERDKVKNYIDIAAVMLGALDKNGCILFLNKKACEILKCTAEEAVGKNWFDNFLPKNEKERVRQGFQSVIKGETRMPEYNESRVLSKDGETHLIAWHNTVLRDSEGKIVGTLSSGEDVTERRELEEKLQENEEKFRVISTSAMDAIILLDNADKILYWNPAAEKMFGYKSEEAVGQKLEDLCVPERFHEGFQKNRDKFRAERRAFVTKNIELFAKRREGTEFPIELCCTFETKKL